MHTRRPWNWWCCLVWWGTPGTLSTWVCDLISKDGNMGMDLDQYLDTFGLCIPKWKRKNNKRMDTKSMIHYIWKNWGNFWLFQSLPKNPMLPLAHWWLKVDWAIRSLFKSSKISSTGSLGVACTCHAEHLRVKQPLSDRLACLVIRI